MEIYKEGIRNDVKFVTSKGLVTIHQAFSLSLTDLSNALKALRKILKKDDDDEELSFLKKGRAVDKENQLRYNILKDIYLTKEQEEDDIKRKADDKAHNEKIYSAMAELEEKDFKTKSLDELKEMLK